MSDDCQFKVTIQDNGKQRHLDVAKNSFVIGRGKTADIIIPGDLISREQVRISLDSGKIWLEELGSSNGTWLDGKKLTSHQKIIYKPGQTITFGGKTGPSLSLVPTVVEEIIAEEEDSIESHLTEDWAQEPKVANGNYPVESHNKPLKTQRPAVKETLSIVARKPEIAAEENIIQIKDQAEQNLIDNIRTLVGSEAEAIRQACLAEARKVKKNAEDFSAKHIQMARTMAENRLKEAEAYVAIKMTELRHFESDSQKKLEVAMQVRSRAEQDVERLREAETDYKKNLEQLQVKIAAEESRILQEMAALENEKHDHLQRKDDLNARMEEFKSEERQFKFQMEEDLAEAHLKLSEINTQVEKSQNLKDSFGPEIESLRSEVDVLNEQLVELQNKHTHEVQALKIVSEDYSQTQQQLDQVKRELEIAGENFEQQKGEIARCQLEAEELRNKAAETLNIANYDSLDILEKARLKSELMVQEASEQVESLIIQKNSLDADVEIERIAKFNLLHEELQKVSRENETTINKLIEKKSELILEIEKIAVFGHEEFHKIVNQGKTDALEIKHFAQMEAQSLKQMAESEVHSFKQLAEAEVHSLKQTAEAEANRIKSEAGLVLEKAESEGKLRLEQSRMEIQIEKEKSLQELSLVEKKKHSIEEEIVESRQKKEDLLDAAHQKVREILTTAEKDGLAHKKQLIDAAKLEGKEILLKVESEAKDNKAKLLAQMTELKHAEMMRIKEIKTQAEEDWINRRLERARVVATNLYALVASEMYKSRNKVMDADFIENFSKEFKEIVVDTMMDRVGADTNKLQSILKTSSDAKEKEKIFWRKVKISSFSGAALMAILILFPQVLTFPRDKIISAFVEKKENTGSDDFLNKVKEARIKAIYNPTTTADYKASYVGNMLFTTEYLSKVQDQAFQDKWILELNDFFIRSLDVKDTTIIKFVSLETTLLKDLEDLKADIDPSDVASGVELMNKREDEFKQKLSEIFSDPSKVVRYYEFSAKFWNDFHHPRQPTQGSN